LTDKSSWRIAGDDMLDMRAPFRVGTDGLCTSAGRTSKEELEPKDPMELTDPERGKLNVS